MRSAIVRQNSYRDDQGTNCAAIGAQSGIGDFAGIDGAGHAGIPDFAAIHRDGNDDSLLAARW